MRILNIYTTLTIVFSFCLLETNSIEHGRQSESIKSNKNIADRVSVGYSGCEKNSCKNRSSLESYDECHCDESCSSYGDCCFDALSRGSTKRRSEVECLLLPFTLERVYVIASCLENWNGPSDIKERCISPDDYEEDIESFLPVTDQKSKLTYRNRFCAACNENNEQLIEWLLNFRCFTYELGQANLSEDGVIRSLVYNETLRAWGFSYELPNEEIFITCGVTYIAPEDPEKKPLLCQTVSYSQCSESWPDDEVRRLCNDFSDPIYVQEKGWFRNIYCAHCNYEAKEYVCQVHFTPFSGFGFPFHSLLNLNMKLEDFQKTRQEESCGKNEKYDKDFKKCRKIRV